MAVGESGSISGTGGLDFWTAGTCAVHDLILFLIFSDEFSIILLIVLFLSFSSIECMTIRLVGWSKVCRMAVKVLLLTRELPLSCMSVLMTDCGAEGGGFVSRC